MTTAATSSSPLGPGFWTYWSGLLCFSLGDAVLYIALPFVALGAMHGPASPQSALGLVVLAGSLPRFLAPLLGALADRAAPKPLLLASTGLRILSALLVGLAALRLGQLPLWVPLLLAFGNGLLSTLTYTVSRTLLPRLVGQEALTQANALTSGALMGGPLVGYGLAGTLLALGGSGPALLIAAALSLGLVLGAWRLPQLPPASSGAATPGFWAGFAAGGRLYLRRPLLLAMLAFGFSLNLLLNVLNVRAPIHMLTAGRGAGDYAVFEVLVSGGMLLGTGAVGLLARRLNLNAVLGLGRWVVLLGVLCLLPGATAMWWAGGAVMGLGIGLLEVTAITRIQELVPAQGRGQALGTAMGSNAVGLLVGAGLAGLAWPTTALLLGSAALLLALALVWPLALRHERALETAAD